jgi:hypothetical protein
LITTGVCATAWLLICGSAADALTRIVEQIALQVHQANAIGGLTPILHNRAAHELGRLSNGVKVANNASSNAG